MSERQETIADIIAKKRKYADEIERMAQECIARSERVPGAYQSGIVYNIRSEADRLEAAYKREVDDLRQQRDVFGKRAEKLLERCAELDAEVAAKDEVIKRLNDAIAEEQRRSGLHGNMAKLREALSQFCAYSAVVLSTGMFNREHLEALLNTAKSALTAPPRNCDVGTAEEQYARYEDFCCKHYKWNCSSGTCLQCPFSEPTCKFSWAQLPYESEAGK